MRWHWSRVATLLALALLSILVVTITATAQDVEILTCSPGQSFTYTGHGSSCSDISVEVSSSITIGASGGQYERVLSGIQIPAYENNFRITTSPVKTINVAGSGPMTLGFWSPGKSGSVSGTTGYFSAPISIPSGTYSVKVYGEPANGASSITMSVYVTATVHTDSTGKYSATLSSNGLPDGIYTLKQGGSEVAKVYLGVTPPPQPKNSTLNLNGGWNLISMPVQPSNTRIDSLFTADQRANIDVIWDYNGGDWKYWTTEPGYTNQFDSLDPSKGYYIYCYSPMSVEIRGTEGSPKSMGELQSGWNLVGLPKTSSESIGGRYGSAAILWKYEGGSWKYWTTEPGYTSEFDTMSPGLGYWVYK